MSTVRERITATADGLGSGGLFSARQLRSAVSILEKLDPELLDAESIEGDDGNAWVVSAAVLRAARAKVQERAVHWIGSNDITTDEIVVDVLAALAGKVEVAEAIGKLTLHTDIDCITGHTNPVADMDYDMEREIPSGTRIAVLERKEAPCDSD